MAVVKVKTWVDLACRLGVIDDTPHGRRAYEQWIRRDPVAAQRPVTAAMPTKASAPAYPSHWRPAGRSRRATVSAASKSYPASWRPVPARRGVITMGND